MGATDYLTKPFYPVFLRARIEICLADKHLRNAERQPDVPSMPSMPVRRV